VAGESGRKTGKIGIAGYKVLLIGMPDGLLFSLPWINLATQAMYQSGRSRFENGCGSYPSWLNCVSYPGARFSKILIVFMVSTAFAAAFGIFRENKHRTWSRAANLAVMRYLFNQKWDVYTLQSFIGATTTQVYQAWAAQEKIEAVTDILPEKAKLHWIGPRQEGSQGRVLLYFFGEAWLISAFCTFTDLYQNAVCRRGLLLASTTRLSSILARRPDYRISFLGQLQHRHFGAL
jgi:hypothetical protein